MKKIELFLKKARYSRRYNGFGQLAQVLELILDDESKLCSLMEVYSEVAQNCKVSPDSVEKNIRTANKYAWKNGGKNFIHEISGETFYVEPTTGELLEIFLDYLRDREGEDDD